MPLASFLRRMDSTTTAFVKSRFAFLGFFVAVDSDDERRARGRDSTRKVEEDVDGGTATWRARRERRARMVRGRGVTNVMCSSRGDARERERERERDGGGRVVRRDVRVAWGLYYFSFCDFSIILRVDAGTRMEIECFHVAVVIDGFARPSDA